MLSRLNFKSLFHADWSALSKKRWVAGGSWVEDGWRVTPPRLVGETSAFVDELFAAVRPALAGLDFPIGVPAAYGELAGLGDFSTGLEVFGKGEWGEFFVAAETPQQVSRTRPFYPRASTAGAKLSHLLHGLRIDSVETLRRQCERATPTRRAAAPCSRRSAPIRSAGRRSRAGRM